MIFSYCSLIFTQTDTVCISWFEPGEERSVVFTFRGKKKPQALPVVDQEMFEPFKRIDQQEARCYIV